MRSNCWLDCGGTNDCFGFSVTWCTPLSTRIATTDCVPWVASRRQGFAMKRSSMRLGTFIGVLDELSVIHVRTLLVFLEPWSLTDDQLTRNLGVSSPIATALRRYLLGLGLLEEFNRPPERRTRDDPALRTGYYERPTFPVVPEYRISSLGREVVRLLQCASSTAS